MRVQTFTFEDVLPNVSLRLETDDHHRWSLHIEGAVPHVCSHDVCQRMVVEVHTDLIPKRMSSTLLRLVEATIRGDKVSALALAEHGVNEALMQFVDRCPMARQGAV